MKKEKKLYLIAVLFAVIGLVFASCGDGGGGGGSHTHEWKTTSETISEGVKAIKCNGCNERKDYTFDYTIGATGTGGGKIIYVADGEDERKLGFTVAGKGTCYYLEAASSNQSTSVKWCNCDNSSCNVTGATGTAIGTGKANTEAIIAHAAHSGDTASNNAAKAANITIGTKNDWFLPSKDELNEMYKAKTHLSNQSWDSFDQFWSSSQDTGIYKNSAYWLRFDNGTMIITTNKNNTRYVRAVRYF